MTRFFDPVRFARLWRAHWAESWREYAWFAAVAAMVDVIFIVIFFNEKPFGSFRSFQFDGQIGWYISGLFASGVIFSGRHFRHLASPGAALITLMRPASLFEKWLLTLMVVCVLFPLAYTLGYAILNFPAIQLAKALYVVPETCAGCVLPPPDFGFYVPFFTTGVHKSIEGDAQIFFKTQVLAMLMLWSVQALVLGGTVFFKRSPVLWTALVLFLLSVVLVWLGIMPQTAAFWSRRGDELIPFSAIESGLSLAQWVGLPLLLWVAIFFHLKEREVS